MSSGTGRAASSWQLLLTEADVSVVRSPLDGPDDRVVVTFDTWRDASERRYPVPYASAFLAKRGIPHVHLFANWNHWYQVDDMDTAIDVIAAETAGFGERIVYGSSMGGFGALQFGGRLGATQVIAIAPQFSMDRRKVPEEHRFSDDVRLLRARWEARVPGSPRGAEFIHDDIASAALPERTVVIYDPLHPVEAEHVRHIAEHHAIERVHVRNSNHWPDKALRDAGLLPTVIEGVMDGRIGDGASYDCPFE